MKKVLMLLVLVLLVGCELGESYDTSMDIKTTSADSRTSKKQEKLMREAEAQAGLPKVTNFQEKKMLKMLYELRDKENLVCHAYLMNEYSGKVGQYLGKCIGYGLPASTQYSNPEKIVVNKWDRGYNGSSQYGYSGAGLYGTLPQAEPNGLFMPEGLSATWLMMIDPKTKEPRPVYVEPAIIVSPFKLH